MIYSIFLDDERLPVAIPRNYSRRQFLSILPLFRASDPPVIIVRGYAEFNWYITNYGLPTHISFDHDLGSDLSGYDCAKLLVEYCLDHDVSPSFSWYCHSQNPIGSANIDGLLKNFKANFQKRG